MASSTTKPTDSVSASIVMLLMEKLSAYITAQVPIRDTGTARAGMIVADTERRNRKITRITSAIAIVERELDVLDRIADRDRSIGEDLQIDRRRHLGPIGRQLLPNRIDHRDRVGAGLPLHRQHHRALVVEPARDLVVLDAVDDVGDFLELDRRAVAPGHDHIAVFLGPAHGIGRHQRDVLVGSVERADRRVGIGRDEDPANIIERDVARGRGRPDRPGRAWRISAPHRPRPARRPEAG